MERPKPLLFGNTETASRYASLEVAYDEAIQRVQESGEMAIRAAAAGSTGFAVGVIEAKWGDTADPTEFRGIPIAVVVSVLGYGAALVSPEGELANALEQAGHVGLGIAARDYGRTFGGSS